MIADRMHFIEILVCTFSIQSALLMRSTCGMTWEIFGSLVFLSYKHARSPPAKAMIRLNAPTIDDSVTTKEALGLAYIMHAFPIYIIGRQEFSDPHIRYR
jgi:hypothetical protein